MITTLRYTTSSGQSRAEFQNPPDTTAVMTTSCRRKGRRGGRLSHFMHGHREFIVDSARCIDNATATGHRMPAEQEEGRGERRGVAERG